MPGRDHHGDSELKIPVVRAQHCRLAQSGSTYSEIVQDARFSIADELLDDPDLNIADIAFAAGYENARHFSRVFKRLTGMTPCDDRCGLA